MKMKTKTLFAAMSFLTICSMDAQAQIPQQSIRWDKHSLIFDGKRVVPVMGEVHYSRIPQDEWREEVRKIMYLKYKARYSSSNEANAG